MATLRSGEHLVTQALARRLYESTKIIQGIQLVGDGNISVLDEKGIYIVDYNRDNVSQRNLFKYFDKVKESVKSNSSTIYLKNSENLILYATKIKTTGWYSVIVMKYDKIFEPVNKLKNILYLVLISMLIISLIISIVSVNSIMNASEKSFK